MNNTEKAVIRNVIARLRCANGRGGRLNNVYGESAAVRIALTGSFDPHDVLSEDQVAVERRHFFHGPDTPHDADQAHAGARRAGRSARIYLDTWVIGALESLLDEEDGGTGRNLKLAKDLSS